eukprot:TRINITY_DN8966_c0_g1_i1.p1 TRINITY_DN8966_c0_g1~~TRINITY_DN8966_c0_g1_i1.p1  ORF type:complete len:669 (+),score=182.08 TRINITY_DN8966_c0_g1_i1:232-2238(+)
MAANSAQKSKQKNRHVEYILLAQFDIDKGSVIKHQFPRPTGVEEQLLAELMLPDGAHKRDDDWTVFFLNRGQAENNANSSDGKKGSLSSGKNSTQKMEAYAYQYSQTDDTQQGWDMLSQDIMSIIIHPNMILINSADGKHNYQIEYHEALEYTQLETMFSCVLVDATTALGLRFTNTSDENVFLNKIDQMIKTAVDPTSTPTPSPAPTKEKEKEKKEATTTTPAEGDEPMPFLYCLNFLHNMKDDTVKRGAVVRSLAVCTRLNYIHIYKPFMMLALQKYFQNPSEEVLADLFDAFNGMDLDQMPRLNYNQKIILRTTTDRTKLVHPTSINYIGRSMSVQIPLHMFPDEVGDYSVITLVQKFGPAVTTIYNALLCQKRVLFIGHGCSAGEVCNYVLAACHTVCPPLTGLIGRVFPYTNLCYLDFLTVPGYVTGVTNPMFEEHPEWWDLCCNINTGKVTLNPSLITDVLDKYASLDADLMAEVNYNVSAHYGEDKVRSIFQDYTQHLIDLVFDEEEFADEATKFTELDLNKVRLEAWKKTITYQHHIANREIRTKMSAIKDPLVAKYVRKLRKKKSLPALEMIGIYTLFLEAIKTEDQLTEFLSYLPESNGGLYPISVSLFHSNQAVRKSAVELLGRINRMTAGSPFASTMNPFLSLAYDRNVKEFSSSA